jgi:hypothetical protein
MFSLCLLSKVLPNLIMIQSLIYYSNVTLAFCADAVISKLRSEHWIGDKVVPNKRVFTERCNLYASCHGKMPDKCMHCVSSLPMSSLCLLPIVLPNLILFQLCRSCHFEAPVQVATFGKYTFIGYHFITNRFTNMYASCRGQMHALRSRNNGNMCHCLHLVVGFRAACCRAVRALLYIAQNAHHNAHHISTSSKSSGLCCLLRSFLAWGSHCQARLRVGQVH